MNKRDEALRAARDFLKLEPNNPALQNIVDQLEKSQSQPAAVPLDVIFNQVTAALKANQTNQAAGLLEQVLHSPQANGMILTQVAQFYAEMRNFAKAEEAMLVATRVEPNASQSWYNLANIQAFQGRAAEAAESIKKAFAANALELAANPRMMDLRENARTNPMFNSIRQTPEFRAAVGTNSPLRCNAPVTDGKKVGRAVPCPPRRARSARPTTHDGRITVHLRLSLPHYICGACSS